MSLLQLLASQAKAPEEALQRAAEVHTRTGLGLAHVLVRAGVVDARVLCEVLVQATGIARFDPRVFKPEAHDVHRLPHALAARRRVLVIGPRSEGGYYVAFTDPTDERTRAAVARHLAGPIAPLLVDEITLERGLEHFYGGGSVPEGPVPELAPDSAPDELPAELSFDEGGSFLTESTDEALRTYLEPMGAAAAGTPDAQDLDWLRAKQTGALPGPRGKTDHDDEPGFTEVHALPGSQTMPGSAPSMSGAADPSASSEPGHLAEATLEAALGGGLPDDDHLAAPTLVDEHPPARTGDSEEGEG